MRIMLIDDNTIELFLNQRILELSGIGKDFRTFNSASSAIQFLTARENQESELPDILFIDIQMPELTGFDVIERLQSYYDHNLPFRTFLLTSSIHNSDIQRAAGFGPAIKMLEKPLTKEKLELVMS